MIVKNIIYGASLGGLAWYLYQAYTDQPAATESSGGGIFDTVSTDLQGGFMTVSNIGSSYNNMGVSISLLGYLKGWEKFSALPYFATSYERSLGKKTIGYGHVITLLESYSQITEQQATGLLIQDVSSVENAVNKYVKQPLTQNQFDALVSLGFNAGVGAVIKVAARINSGDYAGVPAHLMRYVYQNKTVLQGLVNRRNKDVAIWQSAVYA